MTADLTGIDVDRVRALDASENARIVEEHPRSMAAIEHATRTMPRGAPMAWMDDQYEPTVSVAHREEHVDRYLDVFAVPRRRHGPSQRPCDHPSVGGPATNRNLGG